MSDLLLDVAAPLIRPDMTHEGFESALKLASTVWNLALMPPEKQAELRSRLLNSLPHGSPQEALYWANTVEILIGRRRERHGQDQRVVTGVAVVERKGRMDVQTDYLPEMPPAASA